MKLPENLISVIEENDFTIWYDACDNSVGFGMYTSFGQEFDIEIDDFNNLEELVHKMFEVYDDFDVSEETYKWLDETGHGANGAPYDMMDVYSDMQDCEGRIRNLYYIIKEFVEGEK